MSSLADHVAYKKAEYKTTYCIAKESGSYVVMESFYKENTNSQATAQILKER